MKRISQIILLICLCMPVYAQMKWPDNKTAAIVLTYDDGLLSHKNIAIPQLDKAGFKGTFYLMGNSLTWKDMLLWREISRAGHELGNHTVFHPCAAWNVPPSCNTLEMYTVEKIISEISVMNQVLFGIDGDTIRTFAYPCADTKAGGEDYIAPLAQSGLIHAARGIGVPIITDFETLDLFNVPSIAAQTGDTSDKLIDIVKEVIEKKGLGVFIFHGVGGDYLDISAQTHQELIDFLSKNQSDVWVTTFRQAMQHVANQRTGIVD